MSRSLLRRLVVYFPRTQLSSTQPSHKAWLALIIGLVVSIIIPFLITGAILLVRRLCIRRNTAAAAAADASTCPKISPDIYTQRRETFYRRQRLTMQAALAHQQTPPTNIGSSSTTPARYAHGMPGQDLERGIPLRDLPPRYSTLGEPWEDISLREPDSQTKLDRQVMTGQMPETRLPWMGWGWRGEGLSGGSGSGNARNGPTGAGQSVWAQTHSGYGVSGVRKYSR